MRRILAGDLRPGARVDANEIAAAEGVSQTPVINALNRLVGAGFLVSKSNEGFFAPSFTEQEARERYDCVSALLRLALARAALAGARQKESASMSDEVADDDIVAETDSAFRAIMALAANKYLTRAYAVTDARLRPLRLLESDFIANPRAELRRIRVALDASGFSDLDLLIGAYHRRRMRLAPKLIARFNDAGEEKAPHRA